MYSTAKALAKMAEERKQRLDERERKLDERELLLKASESLEQNEQSFRDEQDAAKKDFARVLHQIYLNQQNQLKGVQQRELQVQRGGGFG